MKNKSKIMALLIAVASLFAGAVPLPSTAGVQATDEAAGPVVSLSVFYQSLSPYGRWINYGTYGQVWIPSLGTGFSPYSTNGHWVFTDYGWTWVSDYSWGWGPFHYGRWMYDDSYGWVWVPGTEWAPAWVAWRNSNDYYGWAPLGPGMDISVSIGIPAARWCFVPRPYFGSTVAYRYYVPRARNVTIIRNTTVIRNVNVYQNNRYFTGPSRTEVQRATRRTITPVRIASASRAGVARVDNRQLSIYRPAVERSAARPAPVRTTTAPTRSTPERSTPAQSAPTRNAPSRTVSPNTDSRNRMSPRGNAAPAPERNIQPPTRTAPAPTRTAPAPERRPVESRQPERRTPTPRAIEHAPTRSTPSRQMERSTPRESRGGMSHGRGR